MDDFEVNRNDFLAALYPSSLFEEMSRDLQIIVAMSSAQYSKYSENNYQRHGVGRDHSVTGDEELIFNFLNLENDGRVIYEFPSVCTTDLRRDSKEMNEDINFRQIYNDTYDCSKVQDFDKADVCYFDNVSHSDGITNGTYIESAEQDGDPSCNVANGFIECTTTWTLTCSPIG